MFGRQKNFEIQTFQNRLQLAFESLFGDKYSIVFWQVFIFILSSTRTKRLSDHIWVKNMYRKI